MSVIPSLTAGLAQLQGLASFIDQGSESATFVFYDDAKPASTSVAANDAAKLVTLSMPKPSLLSVDAGSVSLKTPSSGVAVKTGTAVWARLFNGDGAVVADFAIGSDITINSVAIVNGGTVSIGSITLTPAT